MFSKQLRAFLAVLAATAVTMILLIAAPAFAEHETGHSDCDRQEEEWARCFFSRIAYVDVASDGSYSVDWSAWDEDQTNVTGYSVFRRRMMYRLWDNEPSDATSFVLPNSCSPYPYRASFSDPVEYRWSCQGASNAFVDVNGNPTPTEMLLINSNETRITSQLAAPGRGRITGEVQLSPGPNATPSGPDAVWNGPITDEPGTEIEMHFVWIQVHRGDGPSRWYTIGIDGANGFGDR